MACPGSSEFMALLVQPPQPFCLCVTSKIKCGFAVSWCFLSFFVLISIPLETRKHLKPGVSDSSWTLLSPCAMDFPRESNADPKPQLSVPKNTISYNIIQDFQWSILIQLILKKESIPSVPSVPSVLQEAQGDDGLPVFLGSWRIDLPILGAVVGLRGLAHLTTG